MRVVCLHLPRSTTSVASAVYQTKWELVPAKFFLHQLDDITESTQQPFALELYSTGNTVFVCLAAEEETMNYLLTGIYSWLGDVEVRDVEDYTLNIDDRTVVVGADLQLHWPDIYPLQNYRSFAFDTMAPVATALSRISNGDRALIQILVRPIKDTPQLHLSLGISRNIDRAVRLLRPRIWFKKGLATKSLELVKEKCQMHLFWVNYRVAVFGEIREDSAGANRASTIRRLSQNATHIMNAVKVFNTTDENKLVHRTIQSNDRFLTKVQERRFDRPFRLSAIELTTLWHPPSLGVMPNTAQVLSRKAPPPRTLPADIRDPQISFFGHTNHRDQLVPFGIKRFDRRRHLYLLGKSGNGKSSLIQLLVKSDIDNGFGCAVLDPHGDLVDDIVRLVPKNRVKDVVIFDPADHMFPACFNPLVPTRPDLKLRVTLSFLDTFKRVFGGDWSEKMDHLLRYSMSALLNIPGSSIVSLRRLLSDDEFRHEVVKRSPDEVVRRFWEVEFAARRQEFEEGPISQLLNRLDELLATDMLRNILGQPNNSFDFREFMDNRKIVLLKVSKGMLGAENASLLGSIIIWKIYEAAMSRADTPTEARQDFYFYVDEFQNFATDSFGEILAESRKYRLCLTFANQFLGQLPPSIRETVFGNVANLLSFRVGADDASAVGQEFQPRFGPEDLLYLPLREFYLKMSIDGEVQEAFSGRTLDLEYPPGSDVVVKESLESSRSKYALPVNQAQEQLALSEITAFRAFR